MKIADIKAREIFDSRGRPTIECELFLENGASVFSSVPSGLSRSIHEVVELRDGGERLNGFGVLQAIEKIEKEITPYFLGKKPNIVTMDVELLNLDDTQDKSHLGGNTILAVSLAILKAQALNENLPLYECIAYLCDFETIALPCPMFNIINGGLHANKGGQIQEIMIMPQGEPTFRAAMETATVVFHELKKVLQKKGYSTAVGDEGGFVIPHTNVSEVLDLLMNTIVSSTSNSNVMIALDVAASRFYNTEQQKYMWNGEQIDSNELICWYEQLIKNYPIYSIEDGLSETDWNGWETMTERLNSQIKIIGDDIFATDSQRIWQGIERDSATAALIKPNQIGTVTETLQAIKLCDEYNWDVIISHRSGETNDSFIADLAVGVSATQIKAGSCCRGERMEKYNRLLRIEDYLLLD